MQAKEEDNTLAEANAYQDKLNELTDGISLLVNQLSLDNEANTPDYILAEYLVSCYESYSTCKTHTDQYNGHLTKPSTV